MSDKPIQDTDISHQTTPIPIISKEPNAPINTLQHNDTSRFQFHIEHKTILIN